MNTFFRMLVTFFGQLSIRRKLIFAFAAVALVPALILGGYLLSVRINESSEDASRYISDKVRIGSLMWEVQKQVLVNQTRSIALDNFIILNRDLGLDQALSGYLQGIQTRHALGLVLVLDTDGRIIGSGGVIPSDSRMEGLLSPYLSEDTQKTGPYPVYLPDDDGRLSVPALLAVYPVFNYSHRLTGYACGIVLLVHDASAQEQPFFNDLNTWVREPFFIMDRENIFYASRPELASFFKPGVTDITRLSGNRTPVALRHNNSGYLVSSAVLEEGSANGLFYFVVAYPSYLHERVLLWSLVVVVSAVIGSLALALLTGFLLSVSLSAPLVKIALGARAIGDGNYSVVLSYESSDEIGQMAQEFNKMTAKLSRTMETLAREAEEHMAAEQQVRVLNEELELRIADRNRELSEKNILLKEVHHRVKNNMQVISSLLYLQRSSCSDPVVCDALSIAESRIQSMATVHESLYQSGDFSSIDLSVLFSQMLEDSQTLGVWSVAGEAVLLPLDRAVPCALAVNELVMNAVKHAGAAVTGGEVSIIQEKGFVSVSVQDHGSGVEAFSMEDASPGIGLTLVRDLARQLGGELLVSSRLTGGACFNLRFPLDL